MNFSATPGDSLRPYFTSQAAATKGSYNLRASPTLPSTRWSRRPSPPNRATI